MDGHYHACLLPLCEEDPPVKVNEPDLAKFIEILKAHPSRLIVGLGVVCTYGCGILHGLSSKDRAKLLEAIPDLNLDALIDYEHYHDES
jgi:hypothetical protein